MLLFWKASMYKRHWFQFITHFIVQIKVIFVLNFLAGFCLVCIILPIDLLVMSFMRYIRLQFYVIKDDLVCKNDVKFVKFFNGLMKYFNLKCCTQICCFLIWDLSQNTILVEANCVKCINIPCTITGAKFL